MEGICSLYLSLEKTQQLERLESLLDYIEEHLQAAEAYAQENGEEPHPGILSLYQKFFDEALLLKEKVESDEALEQDWNELSASHQELVAVLARWGHGRWVELGPTTSRRLNQFLHAEQEADVAGTTQELLETTEHLIRLNRGHKSESSLQKLLEILRKSEEGSRELVEGALHDISFHLDLSQFDVSLNAADWMEQFSQLFHAVLEGEVPESYLSQESRVCLRRLESLVPLTLDSDIAAEELPDVILDLIAHLEEMESSLVSREDALDWLEVLQELWKDFQEMDRVSNDMAHTKCTVCGNVVPEQAQRCPVCQTSVLSLQPVTPPAPDRGSGTGSSLLDDMLGWWPQYQGGTLSDGQLRSRVYTVQLKLEALMKRQEKLVEQPSPAVKSALLEFYQQIQHFGYVEDEGMKEKAWDSLVSLGINLVEVLSDDK